MKMPEKTGWRKLAESQLVLAAAGVFAVAGVVTMLASRAATAPATAEPESGVLAGCASTANDAGASGGKAVVFGQGNSCSPATGPGAQLPIRYDLATLSGTPRFVAPNGNDSTGNGTVSAPYATVARAYSAAAANDSIVLRGGTYWSSAPTVAANKPVRYIAYPGEIPTFNGAQLFKDGWAASGALKYHAYTPRPVTDAMGVSFTSNQNLTGSGIGKYPDQAWVGDKQLRQVGSAGEVNNDTFYVDSGAGRIYVTASNADSGTLQTSKLGRFVYVNAPGTVFEGIRVIRFSNTPTDYGVFTIYATADDTKFRNVEIVDPAFIGIFFAGNDDILSRNQLHRVTISGSGWMSTSANYTDNLVLDSVKITQANPFLEFTNSPASGALKATKARYTKVINSAILNNNSHGLWCDQSCVNMEIAGNTITDNTGAGIFYEISDDVLIVNNFVRSKGSNAMKLAGASGLKLINNTVVGGPDAIGIYVDSRSKPGCADPAQPLCSGSYSSDRDTVRTRPATLDWIPRLDLLQNNIIAYPSANGFCGGMSALCITTSNSSATVPLGTIIHQADSLRPRTQMHGNVYANGTGRIISAGGAGYTSINAFSSAMAAAPVAISGLETSSLAGNTYVGSDGAPTSALTALYAQAVPVPTQANINQYIPAGTRHYGALPK